GVRVDLADHRGEHGCHRSVGRKAPSDDQTRVDDPGHPVLTGDGDLPVGGVLLLNVVDAEVAEWRPQDVRPYVDTAAHPDLVAVRCEQVERQSRESGPAGVLVDPGSDKVQGAE